jgi:hypothetical protein
MLNSLVSDAPPTRLGTTDWWAEKAGLPIPGSPLTELGAGVVDPGKLGKTVGAIFIGAKGAANLASRSELLKRAIELRAQGVPDEEIWKQTLWSFKAVDQKPRSELAFDPNAAQIKDLSNEYHKGNLNLKGKLPDFVDWPAGYTAHPELKDYDLRLQYGKVSKGYADASNSRPEIVAESVDFTDPNKVRGLLAHEIGHGVEHLEDFARGGSSQVKYGEELWDQEIRRLDNVVKLLSAQKARQMPHLGPQGLEVEVLKENPELAQALFAARNNYSKAQVHTPGEAYDRGYFSLAGEVAARQGDRRSMLPGGRLSRNYPMKHDATDPYAWDVPRDLQIVRKDLSIYPKLTLGGPQSWADILRQKLGLPPSP